MIGRAGQLVLKEEIAAVGVAIRAIPSHSTPLRPVDGQLNFKEFSLKNRSENVKNDVFARRDFFWLKSGIFRYFPPSDRAKIVGRGGGGGKEWKKP